MIRAVTDTSSLFSERHRRALEQAAKAGRFAGIWSPWIVAELNRVLTWHWIAQSGGDLSAVNRRRCGEAAKAMMAIMLPTFELVAPLPPYPPAWESLRDASDEPIWAAAKIANADYVVSENRRHYPPPGSDGRRTYDGIEYLPADAFLALLRHGPTGPG